ncbi:MAG: hypothetical protein IT293_04825 [Deltaproteobacteria bacterium]|nr:hypothetical protein [Deltaproteobacteria bacterium]
MTTERRRRSTSRSAASCPGRAAAVYLVGNHAAVLALVGVLADHAAPVLAEGQARGYNEALHG